MIEPDNVVVTTRRETIHKLLFDNPMQMEIVRFRRRFIHVTESPKLNKFLVGMTLVGYLAILGVLMASRSYLSIVEVLLLQQVIVPIGAIVASHASIAGERDRRSWDLLQVAPVTQHQIVVGKFRGITSLISSIQLVILPALLIAEVFGEVKFSFLTVLGFELLCFFVAAFCAAVTIHLSSRLKSANATLVAGISALVVVYVVIPLLALISGSSAVSQILSLYHPLFLLYQSHDQLSQFLIAIFASLAYLVATVGILTWTGRRLTNRRRLE